MIFGAKAEKRNQDVKMSDIDRWIDIHNFSETKMYARDWMFHTLTRNYNVWNDTCAPKLTENVVTMSYPKRGFPPGVPVSPTIKKKKELA